MSVDELKSLNNLTSNSLSIGQVLKIKESETLSDSDTYIVKSGDTLYSIARKYGLSVNELKSLNNLTSDALSIGQVLKVSPNNVEPEPKTQYYIVKSGDTLYRIANNFGITVDELKRANNLVSNTLTIGQELIIPDNNLETPEYEVYTVKRGDTLYNIARMFNTTVTAIQSLNNLTTSNLAIGQKLLIPR